MRVGALITRALVSAGARVVIHYHRSEDAAQRLQEELVSQGGEVWRVSADLESSVACRDLFSAAHQAVGPLDRLVNSAALFVDRGPEAAAEDLRDHLPLNLEAPLRLTQQFRQQLPENGDGAVLNILDARLRRPGSDHLGYRLTKAALAHLTECHALQYAPQIRVNGLAPGAVLPPGEESAEAFQRRLGSAVPLGLGSGPAALGRAAVELLANPFITGQILSLDGGQFL